MEHPNLEVLQIVERVKNSDFGDDNGSDGEKEKKKAKKGRLPVNAGNERLPVARGI